MIFTIINHRNWCRDHLRQPGASPVPVVDAEGRRLHVERRVNETEAATVRLIFEAASAGAGFKKIAKTLNRDGVQSPRPRSGGARSWTPSSVRTVLFNSAYTGRMTWGRVQKRDQWGQRRHSARPRDQWVEVPLEHLRVVTDDLWAAVHSRIAADRGAFGRNTGGRPGSGVDSRFLLVGLCECGACGSGLVTATRDFKTHRRRVYVCATARERGTCDNRLTVPLELADRAVLEAFERDLLRRPVVESALTRSLAMLRPADDGHRAQQEAIRAEVGRLQAEAARLAEAIATGGLESGALLAAIQDRERRLVSLRAQLHALGSAARVADTGADALRLRLGERLAGWRGLLGRHVSEARQILRHLPVGRLTFTPGEDGGGRFYAFEGAGRSRRYCQESYIPRDW